MTHALAGGGVRLAAGRFGSFQAEGETDMETFSPLSASRRHALVLAAVVAGASVVGSVLGLFGAAADHGAAALASAGAGTRPAAAVTATPPAAAAAPGVATACPGCETTAGAPPQVTAH